MEVGKLYYELEARTQKLEAALNRVNKNMKGAARKSESIWRKAAKQIDDALSNAFRRVKQAAKLTVVTGIGAITAAIGIGIKSAAEYESVIFAINQTIKSTGKSAGYTVGQLEHYANVFQELSTISNVRILEIMQQFLQFPAIRGRNFLTAVQMAMNVFVGLKKSGKQASLPDITTMLAKLFQDPAGMLGAAKRVGVSFDEAFEINIKKLMGRGRIKTAQRLFFRELSKQYGGQAAAQIDTLGGRVDRFLNTLNDRLRDVGTGAMVPLKEMFKGLNDMLNDPNVIANARKLGEHFGKLIEHLTEFLAERQNWESMWNTAKAAAETIKSVFDTIKKVSDTISGVKGGWDKVMDWYGNIETKHYLRQMNRRYPDFGTPEQRKLTKHFLEQILNENKTTNTLLREGIQ